MARLSKAGFARNPTKSNHRWTQMNTDKEKCFFKNESLFASCQYPCQSVFIRGYLVFLSCS